MTVAVQTRRPIVPRDRVLVGAPVAAAQQWNDTAQAAMWARAKGAVLVPAMDPQLEIKTTAEQILRFRVKPRSSAIERIWTLVVYLAPAATFDTTEVEIRCPATSGTLLTASASQATRSMPIVYTETLSAKSATELEISVGIAVPGADASSAVYVSLVSCREQDRACLSEDATDVPTLIETVRVGEPIGQGTRISLGGVMASIAAMDARRVGLLHYVSPAGTSRLSAVLASLLACPVYVQAPKVGRTATTQSVRWAAYAAMSSGGGSGTVRLTTTTSAVTDDITVTSATPAWIDGGLVSISCDDFTATDGARDDLMDLKTAGDGVRSVIVYAISVWTEDVS
jgi:hypothetical protein